MERLVYRSQAVLEPAVALDSILEASLSNNTRLAITGALGFSGGTYVQLLEGPNDSLDALLRHLYSDTRHTDLTVLDRGSIENRLLPDWTMARIDLVRHAPKITGFLQSGDSLGLIGLIGNLVRGGVTDVI